VTAYRVERALVVRPGAAEAVVQELFPAHGLLAEVTCAAFTLRNELLVKVRVKGYKKPINVSKHVQQRIDGCIECICERTALL